MSTEALITLFAKTEGRDRILKIAAGLALVANSYTDVKSYAQVAKSVNEARSIMRMANWIGNIQKMRKMLSEPMNGRDYGMFLRILIDFVYCIHDNLAYFTKYKMVNKWPHEYLVYRSFVYMFWGFFCAALLDVHALTQISCTDRKAWQKQVLILTRNACDTLNALSRIGYVPGFSLGPRGLGCLGLISGLISTKENWDASVKK